MLFREHTNQRHVWNQLVIASRKERKKERKEQTGAHSFSFYRSGSKMELSTIVLVHSTKSPTFLNRYEA
jgi:hypothetical protein